MNVSKLVAWVTIAAGLATLLMFLREGGCRNCTSSGNPAPKDLTSDMYL